MGNGSYDFSVSTYQDAAYNSSIQSLPDFDNPCDRIWLRYFDNFTTHQTWFTNNHQVDKTQMLLDCNKQVKTWQLSMIQIRCVMCLHTLPIACLNNVNLSELYVM